MRFLLFPAVMFVLASVLADIYIYRALKRRLHRAWPAVLQKITALMFLAYIIVVVCLPKRSAEEGSLVRVMWLLYGYISVYLPKMLFVVMDLVASLPRLWRHHRLKWLTAAGAWLSAAFFVLMWWSALVTRNSIRVNEVTVEIPDLPAAFDGYRIVQFSDAHVGTYGTDTAFVSRAVDRINSLRGNLIVFTGDIVNQRSAELEPHVAPLSRLHAPDGVVAILGNHDYGDYCDWPTPGAKRANMELLYDLNRRMGWTLLRDSTVYIGRGGDSLAVIGVENIGDAPFPVYGSLTRAYKGELSDSVAKILLTHNPAHWGDSIASDASARVGLTLSGHTHAMQCKVLGWSPAAYRYGRWGGLHTADNGQQLYINIGLGTVGLPARIGSAFPEITIITLRSPSSQPN